MTTLIEARPETERGTWIGFDPARGQDLETWTEARVTTDGTIFVERMFRVYRPAMLKAAQGETS